MKQYISDLITKEEIEKWESNETVIISAGTGKGKSHFILNTLNNFAKSENKKILLLVPRSAIKKQFDQELDKLDNTITVQTYQWLERELLTDYKYALSFDYIVADESHYFLDDSNFNANTSLSLEFLLQSESIKIFMSATGGIIHELISRMTQRPVVHYEFTDTYENIEHVYFYSFSKNNPYAYVKAKLHELQRNPNEKALVFINNVHHAKQIADRFSSNSLLIYKGVEDRGFEQIKNNTFDKQFLITTSLLDTGVTLKDTNLKHIFVDHVHVNSVAQMIGRKRFIDKNDKVTLHVRDFSKRSISGMLASTRSKLEPLKYCLDNGFVEFLKRYPLAEKNNQKIQGIIYSLSENGYENKVNPLFYLNLQLMQEYYQKLLKNKEGYKGAINSMLNTNDKHTQVEELNAREILIDYLREVNDTRLFSQKEKDELIKMVGAEVNYRLISTPKGLTGYLAEINIPCRVESLRDNRRTVKDIHGNKIPNPNRNKTFWRVIFEEENL